MKENKITNFAEYKQNKEREFAERVADLAERYEAYDPMAAFYQLDPETKVSQQLNIQNSRKLHEEFMALVREDNFKFIKENRENRSFSFSDINEEDYDDDGNYIGNTKEKA